MIMRRHVSQATFAAMLGVILILLTVQMLFVFLGQLGDLNAHYRIGSALYFVFLQIPENLYAILPIGALIGAVVGLGSLATNSELIVMRAAGVSVWRIVAWVLRPALIFGLLAVALSQWLIPPANLASTAVRNGVKQDTAVRGYWHKEGQEFSFISYANDSGELGPTKAFQFDDHQVMVNSWESPSGSYQGSASQGNASQSAWILQTVTSAQILPSGQSKPVHTVNQVWNVNLKPKLLAAATTEPDELSPSQLFKYVRSVSLDNAGTTNDYKLAFWQKVLAPLGLLSLVVLACSFVFGSLRNRSMGYRVVIALMVGLGFRYLQDFVGYVSLVAGGVIFLYVLLPIVGAFLLGAYSLRRAR
ncbi:MAG: LPS export ABC transporter permease LptG [Gammaproteobacteria bacterium]|nr:LPS export ABC transporter permease LptG [Gammaproteobacteria bacterium]